MNKTNSQFMLLDVDLAINDVMNDQKTKMLPQTKADEIQRGVSIHEPTAKSPSNFITEKSFHDFPQIIVSLLWYTKLYFLDKRCQQN